MRHRRREAITGILFILPFFAGFLFFYLIPFCISIRYSFTSGLGGLRFVGLENYAKVLSSHAFLLAASNTFRFLGVGVPLIMVISLGLSVLVFQKSGGARVFQSIFLYPMVIPIGTTVLFFQVMLSEYGVLNRIAAALGLSAAQWLESDRAFYVLVFLYLWKNCGYDMVLFLTGLNQIPKECEEAARSEGVSRWQYFIYIQCPLLMPSFLFVFVISVMNAFKCYREAYLLSGNYPHDSIYQLQHFMNNNFENLNYQRLSVAAIMVFLIIFLIVVLLFACNRRRPDE